ncbi:Abscisic acid 8'-hydroxylase [Sesamum angolense]|uniref:Abscisic acid 8'-hydroxylase n=1 Tax=Sesamum angolense TaxID=2727404 RepID=A0AAE1T8H1_9LAMI|nr:Abscisic acid 8'-hydroxylase [Sesamum angolense]
MDKSSEFSVPVLTLLIAVIIACVISLRKKRKRHEDKTCKLPPGSLGWPYIGETLQLYSQDPNVFFSTRQRRYGEIFKTHILGCPCVMLASPEGARFVLITQAHLFKPTYPKSKENLIGPRALFFHQGEYHMRLRKLVQGSLYPESIRRLVADIEELTVSALDSWSEHGGVINTFDEMKKLSFEVGILATFGRLDQHYKDELKKNYVTVDRGYNSFPTNLPGTRYQKAIKERLSKILSSITRERREKKLAVEKDLLSCLLNSKDDKGETLSGTEGDLPIQWEWKESSGLESDKKYAHHSQGYLIPKGWKVMPLFRNIHHNPEFFPDPQRFDPTRFEGPLKPNTFMPFGSGVHACPGNELAKLEMLILVHHLASHFRYELVGSESGIEYGPFPVPLHGLPARFWKEESAN